MYRRSHLYVAFAGLLLGLLFFSPVKAQENSRGGEISYQFLRTVVSGDQVTVRYLITTKLYKQCIDEASGDLPLAISLKFYVNNEGQKYPLKLIQDFSRTAFYITSKEYNSCAHLYVPLCYQVAGFTAEVELPISAYGYLVALQSTERLEDDYVNVITHNPLKPSGGSIGYTYVTEIPGNLDVQNGHIASSPVFKNEYPLILCTGNAFSYDFSAIDPDGDSLVYSFAHPFQGFDFKKPGGVEDHPPFNYLKFKLGFTFDAPLGVNVTIDPKTGVISGTSTNFDGNYIVTVHVDKYRNGKFLAHHKREIQFVFAKCTWPTAQIDSTYKNCDGLNIFFRNFSSGNISSYTWDFGDPTTNADTSNQREPTYRYPAPGVYKAKLLINKNSTDCKDSAFCNVLVDSGMHASFAVDRAGLCNQALYNFTNTSTNGSAPNNSFDWNFGELAVTTDVSNTANPSYSYPTEGTKYVRMIIGNALGCSDTSFATINIYRTLLHPPSDTVICYLDTISIDVNTGYSGTYLWSPNYNISSLTSAAPLVSPDVTTVYHISFTDSSGCTASDSVKVFVRTNVNVQIESGDTTICTGDTVNLTALNDGLNVTWLPASDVTPVTTSGAGAVAHPVNTGPIIAIAHVGSCVAADTINLKVVPPPLVTTLKDTSVCIGAPVYLFATGGSFYTWTPAETLDDPDISNPIAHPIVFTPYTVAVSDTLGCPKVITATVRISTFRGLFAHAEVDTLIVKGEPVQLTGTGGQYYQWIPAIYLSNANIANPIANPQEDIMYRLRITNDNNCVDYDSIKIRVFNDPDLYVPTAFSPNGDGKNDIFRVFPVGFSIEWFDIYDRWGNKIFHTADYRAGWDGSYKGRALASSTFVWIIKGKNVKTGASLTRKGTVTLIR